MKKAHLNMFIFLFCFVVVIVKKLQHKQGLTTIMIMIICLNL